MSRLGAENLLAAFIVWASIMLPSAAFGGDQPSDPGDGVQAVACAVPYDAPHDREPFSLPG